MRALLSLLMLIGLIWLINACYTAAFNKMANRKEQGDESSSSKRKKVESRVIEKENVKIKQ